MSMPILIITITKTSLFCGISFSSGNTLCIRSSVFAYREKAVASFCYLWHRIISRSAGGICMPGTYFVTAIDFRKSTRLYTKNPRPIALTIRK